MLASRSWRWLRVRIMQLLTIPPTAYGRVSMPASRLGLALYPPKTKPTDDGGD